MATDPYMALGHVDRQLVQFIAGDLVEFMEHSPTPEQVFALKALAHNVRRSADEIIFLLGTLVGVHTQVDFEGPGEL